MTLESTNEKNQANLSNGGRRNEKQDENQSGGEIDIPKTEQIASVLENSQLDNEELPVEAALPIQQENAQETSAEPNPSSQLAVPLSDIVGSALLTNVDNQPQSNDESVNAQSTDSSRLEGNHFVCNFSSTKIIFSKFDFVCRSFIGTNGG